MHLNSAKTKKKEQKCAGQPPQITQLVRDFSRSGTMAACLSKTVTKDFNYLHLIITVSPAETDVMFWSA